VAPTVVRHSAQVVDNEDLFQFISLGNRDMSGTFTSFRQPLAILAPTSVWTLRHTEMIKSIDATGDAIDDALAGDVFAPTEIPIADQATDVWLRTLITLGRAAYDAIMRSHIYADPTPEEREPVIEATPARLAHELRDLTGLSAQSLGAAVGVTREQYQRWLAGRPISDTRHGQLVYLHAIAADVARRLGAQTHLWWKTPIESGTTPEQLLAQRLGDRVHWLVTQIPDSQPVVEGVLVGLPVQTHDDDEPEWNVDVSAAWSPYHDSER